MAGAAPFLTNLPSRCCFSQQPTSTSETHGSQNEATADMAILAPFSTPMTIPESLPQDQANPSFQTEMEVDVGEGDQQAVHMLEARSEEPVCKKVKRVHGEVEMVLRQTAEIVMVLVGVAAFRGGAQPSPLECQLAAEAYEKLSTLVTVSAPQDLVSKDALQSLIQQLTVPSPPPSRPAAKSVVIQSPAPVQAVAPTPPSAPSPAVTKAPAQAQAQAPAPATTPSPSPSASLPSSPLPSPAPGSLSSTSNVPAPPVPPPTSAASSAPASEPELGPAVMPAPAAAVASMPKGVAPASKVATPAPGKAKPTATALEQVQTSESSLASEAPSLTPSSVPETNTYIPVTTSTTPTNPVKPSKPGGGTSSPVKQQSTYSAADSQPTTTTVIIQDQRGSQAPKALARQRGLKNMSTEQPVLDAQQTHRQLALAVQILLKPTIVIPAFTKPLGGYMSTPIPCGICKSAVNLTNNVLVCDGCECGFHLPCLQVSTNTSIPKSDWYCPKCVTTNAGRPQPPKYGPLRRGPAGQSGPKNSWSMQVLTVKKNPSPT